MQKHYNYNEVNEATIREIDRQNAARVYNGWKSRIIAHARQYNATIDDWHFIHDGLKQNECMAFIKEKFAAKSKLEKM